MFSKAWPPPGGSGSWLVRLSQEEKGTPAGAPGLRGEGPSPALR